MVARIMPRSRAGSRTSRSTRRSYTDQKSYLRSLRYGAAQTVRIFSGSRQTARQASVAAGPAHAAPAHL